jgi:hypothetical protein
MIIYQFIVLLLHLAVHIEKIVRHLSRYHKYSLGTELRESSHISRSTRRTLYEKIGDLIRFRRTLYDENLQKQLNERRKLRPDGIDFLGCAI